MYQNRIPLTFFRSVANHELGHIMGLEHFHDTDIDGDGIITYVIMDTGRNRNTIITPTYFDTEGVKAAFNKYPNYTGW